MGKSKSTGKCILDFEVRTFESQKLLNLLEKKNIIFFVDQEGSLM